MTELRISGGDSRIATWNRIKADVCGIPVRTVPGDAAVTGVAMLAGLGAGVFRDVDDAIAGCVRLDRRSSPIQRSRRGTAKRGDRYRELVGSPVARRRDG